MARLRGDLPPASEMILSSVGPAISDFLLAPVFDWFTEGFDTRDLKKAKALLGGSA